MYTVPQIQKVIVKEAEAKGEQIIDYLVSKEVVGEEAIYQLMAQSIGRPFINLKDRNIRQDILLLIPEPIAKTHDILAYEKTTDGILKVAAVDPDDIQTFEFIEKKTGCPLEINLTSPASISQALRLYHQSLEIEFKNLSKSTWQVESVDGEDGDKQLQKLATDLPVVRLVNSLLEYAIFEGASDIHIEPQEKEVIVRYRIDGILRPVMTLPKTVLSGIIARIKILANLKLDEHRLPQDGRFKVEDENYKVSFRVSILPVYDGEKVVMRLLPENSKGFTLEDLGFHGEALEALYKNIKKPLGMILVTGPTGSGKTTTLYAILSRLNTSEVNIAT